MTALHLANPLRLIFVLGLFTLLLVGCGEQPAGAPGSLDGGTQLPIADGGKDPGTVPNTGSNDGGTAESTDGGSDASDAGLPPPPVPGQPLVFRLTPRLILVDTTAAQPGLCGTFAQVSGADRRLVIDLDACNLGQDVPAETVGVIGSVSVDSDESETFAVRVDASDAAIASKPHVVGPLQTSTHGFQTLLGADRAFIVEVPGTGAADVRVELTAALVPEPSGGNYVHLLPQPVRWYAANPNDDGFRGVWSRIDSVLSYPVVGADQGAAGMLGAVHLGPGVWRSDRVWFHMGPEGSATSAADLARWSSVPVDGHFPWRYSSFFVTAAGASGNVEMRASAAQDPHDTGIEPWVDAVGFFSPTAGLVYRPLDRPLDFPEAIHVNDEDATYSSGLNGIEGVMGTLTFVLPSFPYEDRNRWFFVMVGRDASTFPGALGGGLEGPDWMTAGLNQNGTVTVRFVTRTIADGSFVMRHYSYLAGGANPDPSAFDVTVNVRIEGVLAAN